MHVSNGACAVVPHGRLPWFVRATQDVAAHFGHAHNVKADTASTKSGESQERFRSDSKGSNMELDTVVVIPRDPRDEKVLRKM